MRFDLLTIFPNFFDSFLQYGVVARGVQSGVASVVIHDLRSFTHDRHKTVDDRPFGGGEGMVLKLAPIFDALDSIPILPREARDPKKETVVLLSAQGQRFDQTVAQELASTEQVVLICGRYEGVDERVNEALCDRELSIGDYVLSGGELGAAVILDAVVRLLPGVLGNPDSARFESFGAHIPRSEHIPGSPPAVIHASGGLLDYPHYTRPAEFRGYKVPEILTGGSHEAVRRWRRRMALEKTLRNRPDLLERTDLSEEDEELLAEIRKAPES